MYCQSRPFQPLGWKHQWEEKTPWATEKRGTKRALLICHSYWAGNEVVLVLQIAGTSSMGSSGDITSRQLDENIQGCWICCPISERGSCVWRVFSHFLLSRDKESVPDEAADLWSVTHIICSGGTVTFSWKWKPPADGSWTFVSLTAAALSYTGL